MRLEPFLELTRRRKAQKNAKELATKQAMGEVNKTNGEVSKVLIIKELDFHTIILDCSAVPFIDSTGMATLKGLVKDYKEVGVNVLLASCNTSVIDALRKGAFFGKDDRDMGSVLFYTVHAAVLHANSRASAVTPTSADSEV